MPSTEPYISVAEQATAAKMLHEFPELEELSTRVGSASSNGSSNADDKVFEGHDEEQIRLMDEACICVDFNDNPYAAGSKKTCHLMKNIEKGLLHRAFSLFLFNSKGELLLQQRASEKITFPNLWTNTCCSHPLAVPSEMGSDIESAIRGVKNAAVRKMHHELGVKAEQLPLELMHYLARIHYMAPDTSLWGEHEIDYIIFVHADPDVTHNPNEVRDWKWVSREKLNEMFHDPQYEFTPWFKLICDTSLFDWWGAEPMPDYEIRRML